MVEKIAIDPADLKKAQLKSERPTVGKRFLLALAPITFCIGVAATLAWQAYGGAARKSIAASFPQLGWLAPQAAPVARNMADVTTPTAPVALAPDQQQLNTMSLDLDTVGQSVDKIAAGQERIAQTIDQLAADKEEITREITKLQTIEQYILYKNSEPQTPKPVPRPSQTRTAR